MPNQPVVQAAAKLSFFYRVNILSRLLNERGLIHRGVITSGPIRCFKFEGSSLITGLGVLKAAELEKNLKIAGLFYDDSFVKFMGARGAQMNRQSVYIPFSTVPNFDFMKYAPKLYGTSFTQFEGWEYSKPPPTDSDREGVHLKMTHELDISLFTLDQLVDEIENRGWTVQISRKNDLR